MHRITISEQTVVLESIDNLRGYKLAVQLLEHLSRTSWGYGQIKFYLHAWLEARMTQSIKHER